MSPLRGKFLITDESSSIGLASAIEFYREGARVAICGLKQGKLFAGKSKLSLNDVSKLFELDSKLEEDFEKKDSTILMLFPPEQVQRRSLRVHHDCSPEPNIQCSRHYRLICRGTLYSLSLLSSNNLLSNFSKAAFPSTI